MTEKAAAGATGPFRKAAMAPMLYMTMRYFNRPSMPPVIKNQIMHHMLRRLRISAEAVRAQRTNITDVNRKAPDNNPALVPKSLLPIQR